MSAWSCATGELTPRANEILPDEDAAASAAAQQDAWMPGADRSTRLGA